MTRGADERGLPGSLLSRLSQSLETAVGLHFPHEKWRQLADAVGAAAGALGFEDAESCARHLVAAPLTRSQIETLAPHVTVGETYFFREPASFAALEEDVLPKLIHSRRGRQQSLRIWSAGCATGEEPYSIAILMERLIPDIADWRITILGTDINPASLQRAATGVFGEWSFRGAPRWLKERFFRPTEGARFEIDPRIRKMVTFSFVNLAEDNCHPALTGTDAIDVIFCRNVLMYFAPHGARKVEQGLHRALADGGWLVLSATETSSQLCSRFSAVSYPGATLYRKDRSTVACVAAASEQKTAVSYQLPDFSAQDPGSRTQYPAQHWELSTQDCSPAEGSALHPPQELSTPAAAEQPVPEVLDTLYEEALALYEAGRYTEVAARLAHLLSGQPRPSASTAMDGKALALLARAYANQGQLAEALSCCEVGVALDKLNPGSHYLLATILQEHGREAEVVLNLRRALYLDRDFVPAHFALGNLARQQGRHQEATRHFQNAQALLERCAPEEILPESEGMTASSLKAIIRSLLETEAS